MGDTYSDWVAGALWQQGQALIAELSMSPEELAEHRRAQGVERQDIQREREAAAKAAVESSAMADELPAVVLDALWDVFYSDQEGLAAPESYDVIRAYNDILHNIAT